MTINLFIGAAMPNKDRLQKLKEQKEKLEARIQLVENRQKDKERKNDTRRKILLGSYHLDHAQKKGTMEEIKKIMDTYLTRDADRILFDLPEKN